MDTSLPSADNEHKYVIKLGICEFEHVVADSCRGSHKELPGPKLGFENDFGDTWGIDSIDEIQRRLAPRSRRVALMRDAHEDHENAVFRPYFR